MTSQPNRLTAEMRHAPGPWTFRRSMWTTTVPGDGFGIYAYGRARQICGNNQTDPGDGIEPFFTWEEMEANARLIAAAPELLAALEAMCLNMANDGGEYRDCYKAARAAIAKATGEAWARTQ